MRIDKNYVLALKSEVAAQLPAHCFLKIDRGDALFITNADIFDIPGFICEHRGSMTVLRPTEEYFNKLEIHGQPIGDLSRSVKQYAEIPISPAASALLIEGIKLMYHSTDTAVMLFDKNVRRFIAEALRTQSCGGIFLLAMLADTLITQHGGEKYDH